jgi:hypothetical protein
MKIKISMNYQIIPVSGAIIKKITCWQGYEEKGTQCTVGGNVYWYNHLQNSIEITKEIKKIIITFSNLSSVYILKEDAITTL